MAFCFGPLGFESALKAGGPYFGTTPSQLRATGGDGGGSLAFCLLGLLRRSRTS